MPLILQPKPHLVKDLREALLRHLTTILGNDAVAANFMLLHLLSRVNGFLSYPWFQFYFMHGVGGSHCFVHSTPLFCITFSHL